MTNPLPQQEALDGASLRLVFATASQHLRDSAKAIDAINVYPVPDGDTGANMSGTFREAVDRALALEGDPTVAEVLAAIAKGALYGARGNSGVILSQALRGFAAGVGERSQLDGAAVADGLRQAADHAYKAVSQPQEGTMLTVLREAGAEARTAAAALPEAGNGTGCAQVLGAAVAAADRAEAATMEQLEALLEAGLPDAGGEGICVILKGLLGAITGALPPVRVHEADRSVVSPEGHTEDRFGFCTEFLIEAEDVALDVRRVRSFVENEGSRSVVVVGDPELVRVHAHSLDPHGLVESAGKFGRLSRIKIEDMNAQNVRYSATGSGAGAKVALLVLSRGEGFDRIFESLGASVTDLGVVEKPPAGQIAEAADALHVPDVIVLANHKNVVFAAEQARQLTSCTLHVVPTTSLPQGIAAAIALDSDESPARNVELMLAAADAVTTIEVTVAGASRRTDGIDVREGQAIALLNGTLVASAATPREALLAGLLRATIESGSLITLYAGEGIGPAESEATADAIRSQHPGVEIEVVEGGQPLYPFIASVE